MKIGINAFFLSKPMVGSGVYISLLLKTLAALDRENRYYIFIPAGFEPSLRSRPSHFVVCSGPRLLGWNELLGQILWEQRLFLEARKASFDVFHHPYLTFSLALKVRSVVTIHDLAHHSFPSYKGGLVRRFYYRHIETGAKKAAHIITDSRFSKEEITRLLGIPAAKISVIPLAAEDIFRPLTDQERLEAIRDRYRLPDKFILYFGGYDIRKNVNNLIRAFVMLKAERKAGYKLVLAGFFPLSIAKKIRGKTVSSLTSLIRELELENDVNFLGYIPGDDMPAFYSLAKLFVFPSLYEGFGLPVLEAMACGTPVAASSRTSIPEIVNREDLLFDPDDPLSIARKMEQLLGDKDLREDAVRWGLDRAAQYSWEKTALATLRIYEKIE